MSLAEGAGRANALHHAIAPILPVVLAAAAIASLAGVVHAVAIVPLHVPLDPDEGWNAYHAAAAVAGRGLYPRPADFMINNYPPLSFYLVGLLGTLVGDQIIAGRIVSLFSFLTLCGLVASLVRMSGASRRAAVFSMLSLSTALLVASDYVGMDDPQLLGHALQMAAMLLVVRAPRSGGNMLAAALLFVAGGFVKHNLFVLPLAALLWLALFDPRNARRFALYATALIVAGLVLFWTEFGFDLLNRLNSAREWSLAQSWSNFGTWLPFAAIPLCALSILLVRAPKGPAVAFAAIYVGIAIPVGAIFLGGAGVDVNAMFDADIALALVVGLVLDCLLAGGELASRIAGSVFVIATFLPLFVSGAANTNWRTPSFWLQPMREETALAARDIAFVRARPGPVICESLAFCYWAGKAAPVDVFNIDQQLRTRTRDPAPFLRFIQSRRYGAIELDETAPFPLPQSAEAAISRNYRLDHADDEGIFFVPR
ncbi:MAG TPA: glycosyltransferase family 39 protein [Rhizomicrobium sp.]